MPNYVLRAVLLSIAIHFLLFIFMQELPPMPKLSAPDTTEVDIVSPSRKSQSKNQQFVRQALAPDQLKREEDESLARFLSEQRQRVKKESQAALSGMTKNSEDGDKSNKPPNKTDSNSSSEATNKRDLAKEGYKEWNPAGAPMRPRGGGSGPSTSGESLPRDVAVGSFTALNTDRYTYYTFFARVEELIRYRWESRVRMAIDGLDRTTLASIGERGWVTNAEFLLDPRGHLQKVMIMKESGIRTFDTAAVGAFREANIFPNPPKELVEEDGFIHLKYNFTVNYSPPLMREIR